MVSTYIKNNSGMQGVFNPNIPIYHPPNFAEGLHFSAFHLELEQHNNYPRIFYCRDKIS